MLRSEPGSVTGRFATSTVPSVGGKCGLNAAISRSTVDFPHPDGPRMAMNSPLPGRSATENVTSRMTVRVPNRFVTFLKSTTLGACNLTSAASAASRTSVLDNAMGKESALEPEQQSIDPVREQAEDDEDQNNVLRQAAPLARHQQIAEAVLRVDQLGEHDVAERESEQMAEAAVDVGQRQGNQHLAHDLPRRRVERLRRLHVTVRHVHHRRDRIRIN